MLAITLDIDWAPDPIVDAVMCLFDRARIPLTVFATDPGTDASGASSCLAGQLHPRHEIGLHPNFADPAGPANVFSRLKAYYGNARGFKSHQGYECWPISQAAEAAGMEYNVLTAAFPCDVPPFRAGGLQHRVLVTRFADMQMWHEPGFDWSLGKTWLAMATGGDPDELFIAGFHPAPVYYDCATEAEYRTGVHPRYHEVGPAKLNADDPRGPAKLVREMIATVPPDRCVTISEGLAMLDALRASAGVAP